MKLLLCGLIFEISNLIVIILLIIFVINMSGNIATVLPSTLAKFCTGHIVLQACAHGSVATSVPPAGTGTIRQLEDTFRCR
jgi:hypothetical protein